MTGMAKKKEKKRIASDGVIAWFDHYDKHSEPLLDLSEAADDIPKSHPHKPKEHEKSAPTLIDIPSIFRRIDAARKEADERERRRKEKNKA